MRGVQLPTRGAPSAFDVCSVNDDHHICLATPGCLTIFRLSNPSLPHHVIHYEQPQPVDKLKFHRRGDLVGILRAGVVSIWDPNRKLRPLVGLLKSSGPVTALDWSHHNYNVLATGCSGGSLRIWDARSHSVAVQQMSLGGLGSCSSVEWCPTNPCLLAANSNGERVLVFDTRMASSSPDSPHACSIECDDGVVSSTWLNDGSYLGNSSGKIAVATKSGDLLFWDTSVAGSGTAGSGARAHRTGECRSAEISSTTTLLSTSKGMGIVTCTKRVDRAGSTPGIASDASAGVVSPDAGVDAGTSLTQGRTKNRFDLRLYSVGKESQSSVSSSTELARVSATGILGLFWSGNALSLGTGGVPSGESAKSSNPQLLCMTESSSLLLVPVDQAIYDRYCMPEGAKAQLSTRLTGGIGGGGGNPFRGGKLRAPPRLQLKALKDGPSELTLDKKEGLVRGWQFWDHLHEGVLKLEDQVLRGRVQGLSIGRIDQYARQISLTLSFKDAVDTDVAAAASGIRDRSIAVIIRFPSNADPTFALRGLEGRAEQATAASLTIKLGTIARRCASSDSIEGADFVVEVARCFRASLLSHMVTYLEGGVGIDSPQARPKSLGRSLPAKASTNEAALLGTKSDSPVDTIEAVQSEEPRPLEAEATAEAVAADQTAAAKSAVVDSLAYRVPCPPDGGACWGPGGQIICFGRASLVLGGVANIDEDDGVVGPALDPGTSATAEGSIAMPTEIERAEDKHRRAQQQVGDIATKKDQPDQVIQAFGLAPSSADHTAAATGPSSSRKVTGAEVRKYPKSLGDLLVIKLAEEEAVQSPGDDTIDKRPTKKVDNGNSLDESGSESDNSINSYENSSPQSQYRRGLAGGSGSPNAGHRGGYLFDGGSLDRLGRRLDLEQELEAKDHSDESPTRLHAYVPLSSVPCTAAKTFSLGPVNCDTTTAPLWSAGFCVDGGVSSAYDSNKVARSHYIKSLQKRIEACRHNAQVMQENAELQSYFPHSVQQLWTLMWSSLNLLLVTIEGAGQADKEGNTMLNWNSSIIGGRLLRKLLLMLVESQEVQLLATVVCILGGSNHALKLLEVSDDSPQAAKENIRRPRSASVAEPPLETKKLRKLLDRVLYCYAGTLERWSLLTLATEVRNHIKWSSDVQAPIPENLREDKEPGLFRSLEHHATQQALEQYVLCSPMQCFRCGEKQGWGRASGEMDKKKEEVKEEVKVKEEMKDKEEKMKEEKVKEEAKEEMKEKDEEKEKEEAKEKEKEEEEEKEKEEEEEKEEMKDELKEKEKEKNKEKEKEKKMEKAKEKEADLSEDKEDSSTRTRLLWWCRNCKDFSAYCSLCQLPLRGCAFICVGCGHGGHVSCVKHWFSSSVECATGCGCRCAELAVNMVYRQRSATAKSTVYDTDNEGEKEGEDEDEMEEEEDTSDTMSSRSKSVQSDESSASDSYSDTGSDVDESSDDDTGLESFERYYAYFGKGGL